MPVRNIIKPGRLLILIFLLQFVGYFFYVTGIIKSYRITFISTNVFGYVCVLVYYCIQLLILIPTDGIRYKQNLLCCSNKKKIIRLSITYLFIAFVGFSKLTVELIHNYSVGSLFYMILRNRQVDELVYGSGNTILCNFAIVSLMLLSLILNRKEKKVIALWFFNFVFLVVYASFLSSRILILQGVLFSVVIFARRFFYNKKISAQIVLLIVVMAVFLIVTSGFRDYDQMGYKYTESKIRWGISRVEDYLISTANTSLEIDSYTSGKPTSFPENTLQLISKVFDGDTNNLGNSNYSWRVQVSAGEYTNVGAFAQIYSDWRILFIIPVFVIAILYFKFWQLYDEGKLSGYMIWPLFFYNIVETWRINYLGTAMAEALLVICCLTCVVCRRDFIYRGELYENE